MVTKSYLAVMDFNADSDLEQGKQWKGRKASISVFQSHTNLVSKTNRREEG